MFVHDGCNFGGTDKSVTFPHLFFLQLKQEDKMNRIQEMDVELRM